MTANLPRVRLAHLPTPVAPMDRLTQELCGPRLYIKRDDLTGLAGGGNKARKLEFLVADAVARGAGCLVTLGSVQSNHCRQTAAAAAHVGLRCVLVLRGDPPSEENGNLLLDRLLGAEVVWARARDREDVMDQVVSTESAAGNRPYAISLGGSTPLGAAGFALAVAELLEQAPVAFDRIVIASSSGGTQAGLVAGAAVFGYDGEIVGISIDEEAGLLRSIVAERASATAALLGKPIAIDERNVTVCADYLGAGYGVLGQAERDAILLFATREGILLDPVYTGRAAAGMIDLVRKRRFGKNENILFWHTGGTPALYAYAAELRPGDTAAV